MNSPFPRPEAPVRGHNTFKRYYRHGTGTMRPSQNSVRVKFAEYPFSEIR